MKKSNFFLLFLLIPALLFTGGCFFEELPERIESLIEKQIFNLVDPQGRLDGAMGGIRKELSRIDKKSRSAYRFQPRSLLKEHKIDLLMILDRRNHIIYESPDFNFAGKLRKILLVKHDSADSDRFRYEGYYIFFQKISVKSSRFLVISGVYGLRTILFLKLELLGRKIYSYRLILVILALCFSGMILLFLSIAGFTRPIRGRRISQRHANIRGREGAVPGTSSDLMTCEQERWNMPGFLSAIDPKHDGLDLKKLDLLDRSGKATPLFNFRYYRYAEQPEYPENMTDINSLARSFMLRISHIPDTEIILFLVNRRDEMHSFLKLYGTLFISGEAIKEQPPTATLIQELKQEHCLLSNGGASIFFPVFSLQGLAGVILIKGKKASYHKNLLARLWLEIKKFGNQLYQAKIFEQTNVDPESTLYNGMRFSADLNYEFSLKRKLQSSRGLLLIQFHTGKSFSGMHTAGLLLRALFPDPFRLYRIAADVFSLLGPALNDYQLREKIMGYLGYLEKYDPVNISAGYALLDASDKSPQHWFANAGSSLEEAATSGSNQFQVYRNGRAEGMSAVLIG